MKWWKRFAFFERNNYSLPPAVRDDVLPPQMFQNVQSPTGSEINNSISERDSQQGGTVSLSVVNGAGVPVSSLQESADPSHGVNGMVRALSACSNYNCVHGQDETSKIGDSGTGNGIGIDNENESFRFSSTGKTLSIPKSAQKSGNVDGSLVLGFLSSNASRNVHCIDMTVRCNPLHKDKNKGSVGSRNHAKTASATPSSPTGSNHGVNEEDLDGWRGYFMPFAHDCNTSTSNTTTTVPSSASTSAVNNLSVDTSDSNVRHVAVCSDHETDTITLGKNIYLACISDCSQSIGISVHRNPHLYLNDLDMLGESKKNSPVDFHPKVTPKVECFQPLGTFDQRHRGSPVCVDIKPGIVAVGTDTGIVILYSFNTVNGSAAQGSLGGCNGTNKLTVLMEISPPHVDGGGGSHHGGSGGAVRSGMHANSSSATSTSGNHSVTFLKLVVENSRATTTGNSSSSTKASSNKQTKLYVTYCRSGSDKRALQAAQSVKVGSNNSGGGVCCYDLGALETGVANAQKTPNNRHDLDSRELTSSSLCDLLVSRKAGNFDISGGDENAGQGQDDGGGDKIMIARSDGLYTYSSTEKISVSPIDGAKIAMCSIPPPPVSRRQFHASRMRYQLSPKGHGTDDDEKNDDAFINVRAAESGASFVLIATKDRKSGRDAVDIYDVSNKLVAFHLLLSPGHRALRAVGITTAPKPVLDGHERGGLSSAVIITSGGSIVTLTEKVTSDKVSLLVQKNLYGAAISMAFADPAYKSADITALFRKYAEHLYRKGDFPAAMDQYMCTIGALEPSHVIFRFLDAPKIPLLTKYLEELRTRSIATSVHIELLKTCYLKLNDVAMADKISASLSKSTNSNTCNSLVSNLLHSPAEALATLCSFDAPQAVEALKTHGAALAKALPKETAGIVISLCDGVYTPSSAAASSNIKRDLFKESLEATDLPVTCELYPIHLFSSAFLENPKLLRVILAHCEKNKRIMNPSLRRMLLELTLEEWNSAKRSKDSDRETLRRQEAIAMLSDRAASQELGDYETLVIVQQQDFVDGMIMLYEKLQMAPMLLEKYAEDGTYKARRQMLAMCRSDPELLADVLGYFVGMASEQVGLDEDDQSINSESEIGELLDDIKEGLSMAQSQGVLPPVRVVRILAGIGIGQFTEERKEGISSSQNGVPLSVALEYIGTVMDEQSQEIDRLKNNIEEYNNMCNEMESEINELLALEKNSKASNTGGINIDEMYTKLIGSPFESGSEKKSELASEEFWRQMEQSSDRFETIARFFAKDILE